MHQIKNFLQRNVLAIALLLMAFILVGTAAFMLMPQLRHTAAAPKAFNAEKAFKSVNFVGNNEDVSALENLLADTVRNYSIEDGFNLIEAGVKDQKVSNDQCHTLLHYLGHYAYAKYQNDYDALINVVQGSSCIGGYVHGIEAEIVLSSPSVIGDLKNFCSFEEQHHLNNGPCYHGAGHAAAELYSYDVHKALALCDSLKGGPENDLSNCYRGVFSQVSSITTGFDGDTGLAVNKIPIKGLDPEHPIRYCEEFSDTYRSSCESQLMGILISRTNMDHWIDMCLDPSFSEHVKEICINITSVVYIRSSLSFADSAILPQAAVNALPERLRIIAMMGTMEAFEGYYLDKVEKDWKPFCDEFTLQSDKDYCTDGFNRTVKGEEPWMQFDIR